jgi:phage terminase small subunit
LPAKRAAPRADAEESSREKDRPLTLKQEQFYREFLTNGGNASEAYRTAFDAGRMSPRAIATEAHRLLQHPQIARRIADEREKLAKTYGIDAHRLVKELARIALADVGKAVDWSGKETREELKNGKVVVRGMNEVVLKGSDEIDPDTRAAIAEISQGQHGVRVKFHDKAAAIAQLTRIAGLLDEPPETAITITIRDMRAERGGSE